jgi:hypothetical protein
VVVQILMQRTSDFDLLSPWFYLCYTIVLELPKNRSVAQAGEPILASIRAAEISPDGALGKESIHITVALQYHYKSESDRLCIAPERPNDFRQLSDDVTAHLLISHTKTVKSFFQNITPQHFLTARISAYWPFN